MSAPPALLPVLFLLLPPLTSATLAKAEHCQHQLLNLHPQVTKALGTEHGNPVWQPFAATGQSLVENGTFTPG